MSAPGASFLRDTAVKMYFDVAILEHDVHALRAAGYHVVRADAAPWRDEADAHGDLAAMLDFPDYYGRNWDAFNDCLRDVTHRGYGLPTDAAGLVLVLTGFDKFAARVPRDAHVLLDVYALRQRDALIDGVQLICLVQSDDPRLVLPPVGGNAPSWNRHEWLDAKRGV